jgi:chaperonin GroEL
MPKDIAFGVEATKRILAGIEKVTRAAAATLGPRGRNVALDSKWQPPVVTCDGVTVLMDINLPDPFEEIGAKMIREASSRTNEAFGDGTTTAAVLVERIVSEGIKAVSAGANPLLLKRGIDKATSDVLTAVRTYSTPLETPEDIRHVALVSSSQDKGVADVVCDAIDQMECDRGPAHSAFIPQGSTKAVLQDVHVLICEKKLSSLKDFMHILKYYETNPKPLLIIAEDIEGDVLVTLAANVTRGALQAAAVKAPGFGDSRVGMLGDLAILTGTDVVGPSRGLSIEGLFEQEIGLGSAEQVIVAPGSTSIVGGAGSREEIDDRVHQLRAAAADLKDDKYNKERLEGRASKLEKGAAVIKVGGNTFQEKKDRKLRVEDALGATRAALEGGIVTGGGVPLIRAARMLKILQIVREDMHPDELAGYNILLKACEAPASVIAENAGENGGYVVRCIQEDSVLEEIDTPSYGFDAQEMKFCDLLEAGIIDPTNVVTSALSFASSAGSMILTAGCVVVEAEMEEDSDE